MVQVLMLLEEEVRLSQWGAGRLLLPRHKPADARAHRHKTACRHTSTGFAHPFNRDVWLGILLFLMSMELALSRLQGLVLIAGGLLYYAYDFIHHVRNKKPAEAAAAKELEEAVAQQMTWFHGKAGSTVQFLPEESYLL